MPMNKPHLEFHALDMNEGWASPPGYPSGIQQKILASDLDETRKQGSRTRLFVVRVFDEKSRQFVYGRVLKPYLGIPLDTVPDRRPSNTRNPPRDPR